MSVEEIIANKNYAELSKLDDDSFDELLFKLIYEIYVELDISELNAVQKNIYLCSKIEDCTQADTFYTFIEDGFGKYLSEAAQAYDAVGAPITASLIRKAVEMIPQEVIDGGEPSEELWDELSVLDGKITDYPDGVMGGLLREYARRNAEQIL